MEWAAQGRGGVTDPAGVQEMFRCCTEGYGSVGNIGGRWMVGLEDLGGLFQPWQSYDSMISHGTLTEMESGPGCHPSTLKVT